MFSWSKRKRSDQPKAHKLSAETVHPLPPSETPKLKSDKPESPLTLVSTPMRSPDKAAETSTKVYKANRPGFDPFRGILESTRIIPLTEGISKLSTQVDDVRRDLTDINANLRESSKQVSELGGPLDDLSAPLEKVNSSLEKTHSELGQIGIPLKAVKESLDRLQSEMDALSSLSANLSMTSSQLNSLSGLMKKLVMALWAIAIGVPVGAIALGILLRH